MVFPKKIENAFYAIAIGTFAAIVIWLIIPGSLTH